MKKESEMTPDEKRQHRIVMRNLREQQLKPKAKKNVEFLHLPLQSMADKLATVRVS